ncbi:MAG: hypothetical protein ACK4PG_05220 [Acetobacteraceae bacterium]
MIRDSAPLGWSRDMPGASPAGSLKQTPPRRVENIEAMVEGTMALASATSRLAGAAAKAPAKMSKGKVQGPAIA